LNKESMKHHLEIVTVLVIVAIFYFFMAEDSGEYKSNPPTPPESLYLPRR